METQRVRDLEVQVGDMREDNAALSTEVGHLAEAVHELTITVNGLRDSMNRGRGALWGLGAVASVLGGAASLAANKLLGGG